MGGAGEKFFLTSQNQRYLFKPGAKGSEDRPQQPHADVLGSQMSQKLLGNNEYVPVQYISPQNMRSMIASNGTPEYEKFMQRYERVGGSAQLMLGSVTDLESNEVDHYSAQDVEKLQKEQVVDWLISNHDSHNRQFIKKGSTLLGIDKSQAMKYFGNDVLSHDYSPNNVYGEDDPIYNYIYRRVQAGKLRIDPYVIKPLLDKVENIPDEEYIQMFMPFLQSIENAKNHKSAMKGFQWTDINDVIAAILQRKHQLKEDFGRYYSQMTGRIIRF